MKRLIAVVVTYNRLEKLQETVARLLDTPTEALEVNEEQVKELHAKIGELAVANDFLARKLIPRTGKRGAR